MSPEDDATGRRALEERLTHLEKMESIGRLAGGIAHDFNNLLTAILGYTELLLTNRPDDHPDRSALEEIQKAGQRAASLTQQLLAFSRKQVLLPREVDLNQTVLGLQTMLTRLIREDIKLMCDVPDGPALVKIDPAQIEQAILNLVLNARDALPAGGWIRIDVARLRAGDVNPPADAGAADAYVRLRVSDNGAGIAPGALPHLFEPFFTTKEQGKGTGLGLASVYGIVRQSNGWIDVDSVLGEGTTFTMHFPAIFLEQRATPAPPAIVEPAGGHETVLLVEDEEAVRKIISTVLRRQGYTVIETSSPVSAIELFKRNVEAIDLLVTDVIMPVMNGPALAQRLVAIRPALRVLFISGYTGPNSPEIQNQNVGFLSKPFQTSVLAARVREMLNRPDSKHVI
jgi:nitrogen-specific signal transduction histidine kinase/ActR/RegA family two-component response regulator